MEEPPTNTILTALYSRPPQNNDKDAVLCVLSISRNAFLLRREARTSRLRNKSWFSLFLLRLSFIGETWLLHLPAMARHGAARNTAARRTAPVETNSLFEEFYQKQQVVGEARVFGQLQGSPLVKVI